MMKIGAYFIDSHKQRREAFPDEINREHLLMTLIEYEANFQFLKAKFV